MRYRKIGYSILSGIGIEIGALHNPAKLPKKVKVIYCDAVTTEYAAKLFPELKVEEFVQVDHIVDLDKTGLSNFKDEEFDFVVINHVIEHVANPINVIRELFRVIKSGGFVVLSAPDKNYTFDKKRNITSFEHLRREFDENVNSVSDEHFIDFLKGVHPEVFNEEGRFSDALASVRDRREHAHVWDTEAFGEFMQKSITLLNIKADLIYLSKGDDNKFEYFSVWRKSQLGSCSVKLLSLLNAKSFFYIAYDKLLFWINKAYRLLRRLYKSLT